MAQVNTCLKRIFTIFNIFFAVIGAVIIALALLCQVVTNINGGDQVEGRLGALILLYVVGTVTMVISIMGAYGAHKEKKGFLVAFLVCMVLGTLMMLRSGFNMAFTRPQMEGILKQQFSAWEHLDQAPKEVQMAAEQFQKAMQCCGLNSYNDWDSYIPDSCNCTDKEQQKEGLCEIVDYNVRSSNMKQKSIYAKPCFPILLHLILMIIDVAITVTFTLGGLALLGLILSSIIIHQMRQTDRPTVLLSVPAIFSPQPPKYQELHNPPHY